ncbi:hypothetical protein OYC64_008381 [Pagothenia borchgrevinki]|uniref:Uncharacterized protein n=1 Tax=Pagothenia borchgrevinki TaxID=8213 RepID=A0ABD2G4H2_PAGBO
MWAGPWLRWRGPWGCSTSSSSSSSSTSSSSSSTTCRCCTTSSSSRVSAGLCCPRPPPPAAQSPLLLDSAALPPVPLYRLRRFPCGNIGYGYQEQGLPLEAVHPNPPAAPQPQQGLSMASAHQRGASVTLGRSGLSEDSRPLLVTMGTVQDPRLPRMEGHNATVL